MFAPTLSQLHKKQPIVPDDLVWPLSVDQYHRMIHEGILTDDDPVELLNGCLITKMAKNPTHRASTRLTRLALEAAVPAGWYVEAQEPITLDDSEPEPDIAVIRGTTRDYLDRHPGANDVGLVIEVSDTTLERDRRLKRRIYAEARIPSFWIVNLTDRSVEVYSDPVVPHEEPAYLSSRTYHAGTTVPLVLDGRMEAEVPVDELLP